MMTKLNWNRELVFSVHRVEAFHRAPSDRQAVSPLRSLPRQRGEKEPRRVAASVAVYERVPHKAI